MQVPAAPTAIALATAPRLSCCKPVLPPVASAGTRRRRLWELDSSAHCPVLGVGLPIEYLRRLAAKTAPDEAGDDDYRLHCLAVAEARRRGVVAEALHKELDRRYAAALRRSAGLKCSEALAGFWRECRGDERMPGAMWAVLTHARCDPALDKQVLADVHMLQHQRGAAQRVDQARFDALQTDNEALRRELLALRQRAQQQTGELLAQAAQLQAQLQQLRADAIKRETELDALRAELQALHAQVPDLPQRCALSAQLQAQAQRIAALELALAQARQRAERAEQAERAERARTRFGAPGLEPPVASAAAPARAAAPQSSTGPIVVDGGARPPAAPPLLHDRVVLCVGGRTASVPLYRDIVERSGARFLHHDGGDEHSGQRLDASLAAADLVICQASCISHDAYWRVKEHCKRRGKHCVYVDNTGGASLQRALAAFRS